MIPNPDPWITILAGSKADGTAITVRGYSTMHGAKDCQGIAGLIRLRFAERYLAPNLEKRHGFSILAIGCLMVEALESFRNGWPNTSGRGRSEAAFCSFFQAHEQFRDLRPVAHEFYKAIRCGILHQAETTDGWRIHRGAPLFVANGGARSVSARLFLRGLESVLSGYQDDLVSATWNDDIWAKARKKLQAICHNCGLPDADVAKLT